MTRIAELEITSNEDAFVDKIFCIFREFSSFS